MKCGRTSATSPVRFFFRRCVRAWCFIIGGSDAALRLFGFIIGLLMLGAVWLNGWLFHRSTPLVALGLLAVNPSVVRWGDSLRAYGLASVLMLVTLGDGLAFRPRARC